ncbi:MAG: rhodanese-like domain-containing protein [Thermoplasmatales archaeon]|nr:rhodanese-like domain-containing protein [Thermoplasmatales archaeon]
MNKGLPFRFFTLCVLIILFTNIFLVSVSSTQTIKNQQSNTINIKTKENIVIDSYFNLTVEEVWDLIKNSTNGIQILIDVRTPEEYFNERIYTSSFLEKPRLFPLYVMQSNELLLHFFIMFYKDKEIILYCRSDNRSFEATKILINNDFSGTIYNMIGGINEWKQAGLPTI